MSGKSDKVLKIISTPIGNLEDISKRSLECLRACDVIVAEDTRSSKALLKLLGIDDKKRLISFHEHNQDSATRLAQELLDVEKVVLVSDAGSPLLSDPGHPFVKEYLKLGGEIESLPGPSAVTCALEVSGLAPLPFMFHGFAPRKKEARAKFLKSCCGQVTHVCFESPQRVEGLLQELSTIYPEGDIVAARELTKLYEEVYRFKGSQWPEVAKVFKSKGEFVVLFRHERAVHEQHSGSSQLSSLADAYLKKPSPKALARMIAEIKGVKVQSIYDDLSQSYTKK